MSGGQAEGQDQTSEADIGIAKCIPPEQGHHPMSESINQMSAQ